MRTLAIVVLLVGPLAAQHATLDVLDGETLYDGGWLVTAAFEFERSDTFRSGNDEVDVGFGGRQEELRTSLAAHYGLRHDLQLGAVLPWLDSSRMLDGGSAPLDQDASGIGDLDLYAKWRFYRWDARHKALNVSLIGGLTVPTGEDDESVGGMRLEPELQPGRGSFDPAIGFGATYEPYRWRFNAAALWQPSLDTDGDDSAPGDSFVGELAIGNRFWLEPYPGPFMRLDGILRYYDETRAELDGVRLADSGGQRLTAGLTLAFRPRPELDFQAGLEVPFWHDTNGVQLSQDWSVHFAIGYRF